MIMIYIYICLVLSSVSSKYYCQSFRLFQRCPLHDGPCGHLALRVCSQIYCAKETFIRLKQSGSLGWQKNKLLKAIHLRFVVLVEGTLGQYSSTPLFAATICRMKNYSYTVYWSKIMVQLSPRVVYLLFKWWVKDKSGRWVNQSNEQRHFLFLFRNPWKST